MTSVASETLLRYVHDSSKVRASGGVRPEAFLPWFNEKLDRLETSTFRQSSFDNEWEAGERYCDDELRPVKGVAIIEAPKVIESGLQLDPDNDPPGHVSIIGWPEDQEDEDRKGERKRLAQQLARDAIGKRREA